MDRWLVQIATLMALEEQKPIRSVIWLDFILCENGKFPVVKRGRHESNCRLIYFSYCANTPHISPELGKNELIHNLFLLFLQSMSTMSVYMHITIRRLQKH